MDAPKELFLFIWNWLVANPPWFIGIVLVFSIWLCYFLHIRPEKKYEKQLLKQMAARAKADEDAAKRDRQDYFDHKRAEAKVARELEEQRRADAVAMAEQKREAKGF